MFRKSGQVIGGAAVGALFGLANSSVGGQPWQFWTATAIGLGVGLLLAWRPSSGHLQYSQPTSEEVLVQQLEQSIINILADGSLTYEYVSSTLSDEENQHLFDEALERVVRDGAVVQSRYQLTLTQNGRRRLSR